MSTDFTFKLLRLFAMNMFLMGCQRILALECLIAELAFKLALVAMPRDMQLKESLANKSLLTNVTEEPLLGLLPLVRN